MSCLFIIINFKKVHKTRESKKLKAKHIEENWSPILRHITKEKKIRATGINRFLQSDKKFKYIQIRYLKRDRVLFLPGNI